MGIISLKDGYAVRFYYKDCFGNRQRKYKAGFPTKKKAEMWEYQEKEKMEEELKKEKEKNEKNIDNIKTEMKRRGYNIEEIQAISQVINKQ